MRYNRYIAVGFVNGAIKTSEPFASMNTAATTFFKEHRHATQCNIRRVMVRTNGEIVNDPDFKMRKMGKITA